MSLTFSLFLLQATATITPAALPVGTPLPGAKPPPAKTCRDMLVSSSRLGAIKVCKTRAQWARWERCHSATRYCPPPVQQTVTMASLPDEKLICKYLKETGSRVNQQKICATKHQWEAAEQETQDTVLSRQNQSKIIRNGGD